MFRKLIVLIFVFFSTAYATTSKVKQYKTYADFKKGEFHSITLSENGELSVAPAVTKIFDAVAQHVWNITVVNGKIYTAAGTPLKIYQVEGGDSTQVFSSEDPSLFAMAGTKDKAVFFAPAPDGIIYKLHDGTVSKFAELAVKYIWHILPVENEILVATGNPGLILQIDSQAKIDTIYASTETHIRVLARNEAGTLYAGSADHGLIYRFDKNYKPFVLFDSPETEIFSIIPASGGDIWAAGISEKMAIPMLSAVAASATSAKGASQAGSKNGSKVVDAIMPTNGGDDGAVYKISAEGIARNYWKSQSQRVQAMMMMKNGDLLIGTGDEGRLYGLGTNGDITQILDLDAEQIVGLYPFKNDVLLATSNNGAVHKLASTSATKGRYVSDAFDAGSFTKWGSLSWTGKGAITFSIRSGNTEEPDDTWSEWTKLPVSKAPVSLTSPTARFIQWQAELSNTDVLQSLSFGYKQQNIPPHILDIEIHNPGEAYLDDVREGIEKKVKKSSSSRGKKSMEAGYQSVSWTMDDANDDPILCTVMYQMRGTTSWRRMVEDYSGSVYSWDTRSMEDGYYFIKVQASDKINNFQEALSDTHISEPLLVDNTAPEVVDLTQKARKVSCVVRDAFSRIQSVQFAVDSGEWNAIFPLDGIADSAQEIYHIGLDSLSKGEHTVMIKAEDERGNKTFKHINVRF